MARMMIIPLLTTFISLSTAQQLSFGDSSNRWWFFAMPAAQNLSISFPDSIMKGSQPAAIRDDYTYTAGIGAHKVHTRPAAGWNAARRTCDEEGGYLAVVNSVAEADTIAHLLKQANLSYGFIGFHDYFNEGEYVTMHGDSLAKAGYTRWTSGQPNAGPGEHCGGLDNTGGLHDVICAEHSIFVCELSVA